MLLGVVDLNVLCKIFNFVLNMFNAVLNVAVEAVNSVIGAAITVLESAADSIFGGSGVIGLAIAGALLYFIWPSDEDERRSNRNAVEVQE